ncbi:MAG: hypothetical protein ACI9JM_001788 [Halioglobus sp.]|jgi:uncharacterized protein (TIGR00730 family)
MSENENENESSSAPKISARELGRIARIGEELGEGIESLADIGPAVTIFGSARTKAECREYRQAQELARRLSAEGIAVITGGGPGIMAAANSGASEEIGASIGLRIELPFEEAANPHLDVDLDFRYFFTRKYFLMRDAIGFAIFPGGFGTADELFELLTLTQTGKLRKRPIVLIGKDFWQDLYLWMEKQLQSNSYISDDDMNLVEIVDDVEAAAAILLASYREGTS